jgi:HEAT repeats
MVGGRAAGIAAVLVGCCFGAGTARGQLQGHISMAKEVYLAGEPIYVHFEVTNAGNEPVQYASVDPYVEECSSYRIDVSEETTAAQASCRRGKLGDCLMDSEILGPGATLRQNILLNYAHDVKKAGEYEIRAVDTFRYAPITGEVKLSGGTEFKVEQRFHIRLVKADQQALEGVYKTYVTNLASRDPEIQTDAQRAIVSGAPPWLEDTVVDMLRQSTSREFALLGLKNLNTPRAREELAKIVENSSELTQENVTAVGYLGQMGDKKYFPLLLKLAQKVESDQGREYVLAAAELGGADAVPFLQGLLRSTDPAAKANAVLGLEQTGSRAAVPLLMEQLKDPHGELGSLALNGLVGLTHRSPGEEKPAVAYADWEKWWAANAGRTAVYGPRECGDIERLPEGK